MGIPSSDGTTVLSDRHEAILAAQDTTLHEYSKWAEDFHSVAQVDSEGHRFIEVPEMWMVTIPVIDILERAARAEYQDPRPICAKTLFDTHCRRPIYHRDECGFQEN